MSSRICGLAWKRLRRTSGLLIKDWTIGFSNKLRRSSGFCITCCCKDCCMLAKEPPDIRNSHKHVATLNSSENIATSTIFLGNEDNQEKQIINAVTMTPPLNIFISNSWRVMENVSPMPANAQHTERTDKRDVETWNGTKQWTRCGGQLPTVYFSVFFRQPWALLFWFWLLPLLLLSSFYMLRWHYAWFQASTLYTYI